MTESIRLATADRRDLPKLHALAAAALVHDDDAAALTDLLWHAAGRDDLRITAFGPGWSDGWDGSTGSDVPLGFAIGSLRPATATTPTTGHVVLIAVHPNAQTRGHGRALLTELERRLHAAGAERLVIRGNPPTYAWPGIDVRYTKAVCLAESSGYERTKDGLNLTVDLHRAPLDTEADEQRLADAGVTVRRLRKSDEPAFSTWMRAWGGSWEAEAQTALDFDPVRAFVAVRNDAADDDGSSSKGTDTQYVGFACHGVNRRAWFGPMGTEASERGLGIGAVLLRRCLAEQRDAGLASAEIGWTAPIHFYARAVGATLGRVFWCYAKESACG